MSRAVKLGGAVTVGDLERFDANERFLGTFAFRPEVVTVKSGDTITWQNIAETPAPHTITLMEEGRPGSVVEMLDCSG